MMRFYTLILIIVLNSCHSDKKSEFSLKPGTQTHQSVSGNVSLNYLLYLPEGYDINRKGGYPTILFLHGAGERGSDLDKLTTWGPPKIAKNKGLPFIVISPQCPDNEWWTSLLFPLKVLLDESIKTYNIDTDRIYLTGLSMGGYGTFAMSQVYGSYFAAVAPICGGGTPSMLNFYKQPPTWVFHGDIDTIVPIQNSRIMVDAIEASGSEVKFTIYKGVNHYSFERAYNNSNLFNWFLEHKKGDK